MEDEISVQSSVHRVQLTLDDLSYSEGDHMSATTEMSIPRGVGEHGRDPQGYRRELTKLLKKSRGTPYEKTLRKFVESKLREIDQDINQKSRMSANTVPGSKFVKSPGSPGTAPKIDLFSLSRSKYDSPQRGKRADSSFPTIPDEELSRLRLEELSQPFERHRYQGVYDYRVTTNHIGRQRPPPKLDETLSRTASPSRSRLNIVTSSTIRHQSNPNSPLRRSQELLDTPNTRVPVQEFRQWLRRNKKWENNSKSRMELSRERISAVIAESSKPRITKKSVKLAELAQNRESMEYLKLQEYLRQETLAQEAVNRPVSNSSNNSITSFADDHHFHKRPLTTIALGGTNEYLDPFVDADVLVRGSLGNDVFERLSVRGKMHAERKKLLQEREQAIVLAQHSFQPQLTPHTEKLAAKYFQRKFSDPSVNDNDQDQLNRTGRSRSRSRENLLGRLTASTASTRSISRERPMTTSSLMSRSHSAPAIRRSISSVEGSGGNMGATSSTPLKPIQRSSSPPLPNSSTNSLQRPQQPPRRSRSIQELVQEDIQKVRAKSRDRRNAQVRYQMKCQYLVASTASSAATNASSTQTSHAAISSSEEPIPVLKSKPFTPTLVARNTTNQLVKSSFEERNLVAVERKIIRQVLSSREPSPGPGQYHGMEVTLEQRLSSPPRRNMPSGATMPAFSSAESYANMSTGKAAAATTATASSDRFQSPGSRGYSFSKGKLRSSIIPTACSHEDVNKLTYQAIKQQPLLSSSLQSTALVLSPRASLVAAAVNGQSLTFSSSVNGSGTVMDRDDTHSAASVGQNTHSSRHFMHHHQLHQQQQQHQPHHSNRSTPNHPVLSVSTSPLNHSNHQLGLQQHQFSNNHPGSSNFVKQPQRSQPPPPSSSNSPIPVRSQQNYPSSQMKNRSSASASSLSPPPPPSLSQLNLQNAPPAASLTTMLSATAYHI